MANLVVERVTCDAAGYYMAFGYDADTREKDAEPVFEDEARDLIEKVLRPPFVDGPGGIRVPVLPRLARPR